MTAQHKALQLADLLETVGRLWEDEAAEELRRLHQSEKEAWRYADELEQERKRLTKAAEMALACLDKAIAYSKNEMKQQDDARIALRQALAEPANFTTDFVEPKASSQTEQKPVAWLIQYKTRHDIVWGSTPGLCNNDQILGMEPFYAAPPKREWVGLTDEEIIEVAGDSVSVGECARLIEAKLKEKNT